MIMNKDEYCIILYTLNMYSSPFHIQNNHMPLLRHDDVESQSSHWFWTLLTLGCQATHPGSAQRQRSPTPCWLQPLCSLTEEHCNFSMFQHTKQDSNMIIGAVIWDGCLWVIIQYPSWLNHFLTTTTASAHKLLVWPSTISLTIYKKICQLLVVS